MPRLDLHDGFLIGYNGKLFHMTQNHVDMKIAAFAVAAIVLSRVLECAPAPISVVDSTGLGLQITALQVLGTYTSPTNADGKQQLERRARKVEVNTADGSGCMHRQWTCGSCSGISNETLMMVNDRKCYRPTGSSSYDCDGQRISVGLVAAVQNGHCVETCSLRPKPLHCSEPAPTGMRHFSQSTHCSNFRSYMVNATALLESK